MSFDIIHCEDQEESNPYSPKKKRLHRCVEMCVGLKDGKILVATHGTFVFCLGVVLLVGHFAINGTTSSTVHTEPSIPNVVNSVLVLLSGLLYVSLVVRKHKYLVISAIALSTTAGVLAAIAAVHYGITVSNRLTSLSDCFYASYQRLCTCSVVTSSSRVTYNFENVISCTIITEHLRDVAHGMFGVYAVTFVSCFGAAVYEILLAHKIEIKKIKPLHQESDKWHSKNTIEEKQPFDEQTDEFSRNDSEKSALPWRMDVATQTASPMAGGKTDTSCRHKCRHFVEVTVPDARSDFVVNITKSRDPPPPYCETVYT